MEVRFTETEIFKSFEDEILNKSFFQRFWEKEPFVFNSCSISKAISNGKWINLEMLFNMLVMADENATFFKEGARYNSSDFAKAYVDGASIILNQADRYNQSLFEFCKSLANQYFYHVFAVAYLTPKNSYAVRAHTDDQDVFLIQLWGKKLWKIYSPPIPLPLSQEMIGKDEPIKNDLGKPILNFELQEGQILYIPRGFPHSANTSDINSLHITITIPTSDFCLAVRMENSIKKIIREQLYNENLHLALRSSALKLETLREPKAADTHNFIELLGKSLTPERILNDFVQHIERMNKIQLDQFQMLKNCNTLSSFKFCSNTDFILIMNGITLDCSVSEDKSSVCFHRGNESLVMKISSGCFSMFKQISLSIPIQIKNLEAEDPFERLCVCRLLILKGLIKIFNPKDTETNN